MYDELMQLLDDLFTQHPPDDEHRLLVIGCSTSEVTGRTIGSASSPETAARIYSTLLAIQQKYPIHLAVQCCEHLNRALLIEQADRTALGLRAVNAVPHLHAGGAFATHVYSQLEVPCLVEHLEAQYGIDIGETFIGMHLQDVVVPFKSDIKYIGKARVKCCFTRDKYIGGERAAYRPIQ